MKFLREGCFFGVVIAAGVILSMGCGGSSGSTPPPATTPVSINTLDGQTNIPIDSTFQYTFTRRSPPRR